jgi:MATE family multidrug resistance protein
MVTGNSFWPWFITALTSVVAQLNGSEQHDKIPHQIQQGFWLALIISMLIMGLIYNSGLLIDYIPNIDPLLAEKTKAFLHAIFWGAPGYLFFQVLRNQCEGLSKTWPGMLTGFIGLLINIPINYIFIYGKLGAPALGGVGCGIATASVYWIMFLLITWYVKRAHLLRNTIPKSRIPAPPEWKTLKRLIDLGLPIALHGFLK